MDKEFSQKIFEDCPTRFTRREKNKLLLMLREKFRDLGYDSADIKTLKHKGIGKSHNFVVGRPDAPYIFTAHYDTPGKTGFLLFASRFVGQTGANIVYILLCIAFFAAISFGTYKLTDLLSDSFGSGIQEFLPLFIYVAVMLGIILLMFVPMIVKNKNNRNDNTSGVIGLLTIAEIVAQNPELRDKCCFVFFDNEEWGLLGSAKYSAWLKNNGYDVTRSMLINLDCIGVGDKLVIASVNFRNKTSKLLKKEFKQLGVKAIRKKSMMIYMSDHASFKGGVMLAKTKRSAIGPLYIPNIHTGRDTECDLDAVSTLCEQITDIIGGIEKGKNEQTNRE